MTYLILVNTALLPTISENASLPGPSQQRVQVRKFPTFALMTHPKPLTGIPSARDDEKGKMALPLLCAGVTAPSPCHPAGAVGILCIERLRYVRVRKLQQRFIFGKRFLSRHPENQSTIRNQRLSSRFAKNRTSSASTRFSISGSLVSRVGTTTSVRNGGRYSAWKNPCAAANGASPAKKPSN